MPIWIHHTTLKNIADIMPLFDTYRLFYNQPADLDEATGFFNRAAVSGTIKGFCVAQ